MVNVNYWIWGMSWPNFYHRGWQTSNKKELDCAFRNASTHRPDENIFKKYTTCIKTWLYSTQNNVLTMAIPSFSMTNEQHTKHAQNWTNAHFQNYHSSEQWQLLQMVRSPQKVLGCDAVAVCSCLGLISPTLFLDCLFLKMQILWSFEMPKTAHPITQHHPTHNESSAALLSHLKSCETISHHF